MKRIPKFLGYFLLIGMMSVACSDKGCTNLHAVVIITDSGQYTFEVEIADTPELQRQGLMERTDLEADQGMLFIFDGWHHSPFWMKNTPLSLDILYLGEAGQVLQIADHTTPYSEELIVAEQAYRYVLEVLAGTADHISLKVGDLVQLPDS